MTYEIKTNQLNSKFSNRLLMLFYDYVFTHKKDGVTACPNKHFKSDMYFSITHGKGMGRYQLRHILFRNSGQSSSTSKEKGCLKIVLFTTDNTEIEINPATRGVVLSDIFFWKDVINAYYRFNSEESVEKFALNSSDDDFVYFMSSNMRTIFDDSGSSFEEYSNKSNETVFDCDDVEEETTTAITNITSVETTKQNDKTFVIESKSFKNNCNDFRSKKEYTSELLKSYNTVIEFEMKKQKLLEKELEIIENLT